MLPFTQQRNSSFRNILLLAAWFGLVAGLVEGALFLICQNQHWLAWDVQHLAVAREILWISPIFNLVLFVAVGLLVILTSLGFSRLPLLPAAFFVLSSLTYYDWLSLTGKIRISGALSLALGLATVSTRWFRKHEGAFLRGVRTTQPWAAGLALLLLVGIETGQWYAERRATAQMPEAPAGAPNILIVVMDTVRADHLSAYGYARPTSPNFDRLARQGAQFDNAISTSSWTLPAHASLLTGRLPHEHGATNEYYTLHLPNIAEELRSRGFRTGAFSANTFQFSRVQGFGGGFIHFEDVFTSLADMMLRTVYGRVYLQQVLRHAGPVDVPGRKRAEDVNASFFGWIDWGPKNPFFVILNYFDAHDPYLPPQPYRSMFSKIPNPGGAVNHVFWRLRPRSPEVAQSEMDAYDGGIAYMDAQIGKLFAGLEARGLKEKTLVIILADHGEMFGEHDLYGHRNALYRPLIHIPMVFYWPGHVPAGKHVESPVSLASIPATLLELLGSAEQTQFPGPSLAPLWTAADPPPDLPYPISELGWFPFELLKKDPAYFGPTVSATTPRWEFIKNQNTGVSIFDWTKDSRTLNDLFKTAEGQTAAAVLEKCMKDTHARMSAANCPVK